MSPVQSLRTATGVFILRFHSDGDPNKHLLILAGQHGNEHEPTWALAEAIREGRFARAVEPSAFGTVTVVPQANPWGLAVGVRERDDGLDPNRQWGLGDEPTLALIRTAFAPPPTHVIDLHTGVPGCPSYANTSACNDEKMRCLLGRLRERGLIDETLAPFDMLGSLERFCTATKVPCLTLEATRGDACLSVSRKFVNTITSWISPK